MTKQLIRTRLEDHVRDVERTVCPAGWLLIKVCVDLIRHRATRFTWLLTIAFVFVAVGVPLATETYSTLNPEQLASICTDLESGIPQTQIAKRHGIS